MIDYENMAFFLPKNHWVKICGGGEHFRFWPWTCKVKMDVFGHSGQIWPDQIFFGPPCQRRQNYGQNEVWNTPEAQKLAKLRIKMYFSENAGKIMNFGGLVRSRRSRELIFEFLSVPKASYHSVLPTNTLWEVWDHSENFFLKGVQIPWRTSFILHTNMLY